MGATQYYKADYRDHTWRTSYEETYCTQQHVTVNYTYCLKCSRFLGMRDITLTQHDVQQELIVFLAVSTNLWP